VVAVLAALAGLAVVHRLAAVELGPAAARRAVWLLALFPGAFFFGAAYSEGPFLLFTAGAVLAARRERWVLAGAAGAAAVLTRSTGILVLVPLVVLAWRARPPARAAAWLALVPAALAGWLAVAGVRAGDVLAPWHAQAGWGRGVHAPLAALVYGIEDAWRALPHLGAAAAPGQFEPPWMKVALLALALAALAAAAGAWRRLGAPYGSYAVLALAVPLSVPWPAHPLMSFPRFAAVAFPLTLWAARRRRAFWPLVAAFAVGLAVLGGRFGVGAWAA